MSNTYEYTNPPSSRTTKPKHNDAGEVTSNSIEDTLAVRGKRYGDFENHAKLSQALKDTFFDHVVAHGHTDDFTPTMTEAIEMIFHKLARIANGDPTYDDNYRDIAGFAQLVVNTLTRKHND